MIEPCEAKQGIEEVKSSISSDPGAIFFEVPGNPQGKGRPRFARAGHFVKVYTDKQTVNYETFIREMFYLAYPEFVPLEGQLEIELDVHCPVAKVSKKKRALMLDGSLKPAKKPEVDNILKVFLDALTGLAFKNDNQVVRALIEKRYSERPHVEIFLKEV